MIKKISLVLAWIFIFTFFWACNNLVETKKNLKNRIIDLGKDFDTSFYEPLVDRFVWEMKKNYEFFYEGKDNYDKWYSDYLLKHKPYFRVLKTGLSHLGGGTLDEKNWEIALKHLKEMTENLKDQHFRFLELLGREIRYLPREDFFNWSYFKSSNPAFKDLSHIKEGFDGVGADLVSGKFLDDKVLYFHFSAFSEEFIQAPIFIDFHSNIISGKYEKIILDLRNNEGGNLDSEKKFVSYFFYQNQSFFNCLSKRISSDLNSPRSEWKPKDQIISTLSEKEDKIPSNVQIVILVDKNTASTAEITIMALRKRRRLVVVGQPTRGAFSPVIVEGGENEKASQYELINPYNKEISLSWQMGSGAYRSIRGEKEGSGLIPDILVEFDQGQNIFRNPNDNLMITASDRDPQLEKARQLLKMTSEEFEKESNKYYTGNIGCPKL